MTMSRATFTVGRRPRTNLGCRVSFFKRVTRRRKEPQSCSNRAGLITSEAKYGEVPYLVITGIFMWLSPDLLAHLPNPAA